MIQKLRNLHMEIHPTARVAPNATLVGAVTLKEGSSVWYGAVLRGDVGTITVGKNSTVEDNCVLHGAVTIGENCIIGHGAILHECTLGNGVLIGMGATVLSNAVIGAGSIVAAGAVVTERTVIPPQSMVMGVPGKITGPVSAERQRAVLQGAASYRGWAEEQFSETDENEEQE